MIHDGEGKALLVRGLYSTPKSLQLTVIYVCLTQKVIMVVAI